ncbi:MAG: DeoR/GlpR family DNA-binding transcription regulator [Tissierellia bacterium]|nr:DeoR/GlpR family DNA-binding transcription regulator [Tissierellia bacterium]
MEERLKEILSILEKNQSIKIVDLCDKLYVSRSTIRRDLLKLEEEGVIKRYYGGVRLINNSSQESPQNLRAAENIKLKEQICSVASHFLKNNMVMFLDSSSTILPLLNYINDYDNITIITNSLDVSLFFKNSANIKVYITPGYVKLNSVSIIGEFTSDFISHFKVDFAFYSCKSINNCGVYEGDELQANVKRNMIKNAKTNVLLCDSSKVNGNAYFRMTTYENINYIISDKQLPDDIYMKIKNSNCKFIKA